MNDACNYANIRARRMNDNTTVGLVCRVDNPGDLCEAGSGDTRFNADDNTQRTIDMNAGALAAATPGARTSVEASG